MQNYEYVKRNYLALKSEIDALGEKAGRKVTLVAVTKSGTDEELLALMECGVSDVGENRPQELKRRGELMQARGFTPALHEIGNLQKNKIKQIIDKVALIHSVDSEELALQISKRASEAGRTVPVLIEINSAEEESKGGVSPQDAESLYLAIRDLPSIEVRGLMTMGPAVKDGEALRPYFKATKAIFDELNEKYGFSNGGVLSMGMSDSYAVAIEEGATMVRVGSRLFEKTKGEQL